VSEALDVQPGETILVNGAGGVTGGMIVELAANRSARVIATASESSAARVMALGADVVVDYHDPEWTSLARDAARSSGIRAAANAAGGGEADALSTLVDRGRLATITGAPPPRNGASASRTSSSARTATSYACSPRLSRRASSTSTSEPPIRSQEPRKRSRRQSKGAAAPSSSNHERVALARTGRR
jgi:NADPH:quinone reductase-like Zn-dependent oxidoreductase